MVSHDNNDEDYRDKDEVKDALVSMTMYLVVITLLRTKTIMTKR